MTVEVSNGSQRENKSTHNSTTGVSPSTIVTMSVQDSDHDDVIRIVSMVVLSAVRLLCIYAERLPSTSSV